jgi:hypothetical protein
MKKEDIIKSLKVRELIHICRLYKLKTGRRQVMIEMLTSNVKRIPKRVIVEAKQSWQRGLGGGNIAESVEQRNEIQNLVKLFPDTFPDTFPAPHVEESSLNGNEIDEIKDKLLVFNAEVLHWNQTAPAQTKDAEDNSINQYNDLIAKDTILKEQIADFVVKIPDGDVTMFALRHGLMIDPIIENQTGQYGGSYNAYKPIPKVQQQESLKKAIQRHVVPIFRMPTETMEHKDFIKMKNEDRYLKHNDFTFDCNYYDSYCESTVSLYTQNRTKKLGVVIFDEHPYKNIWFKAPVDKVGKYSLKAFAEHDVNVCIQFSFTNEIENKRIILVKKQTSTELSESLNTIYDKYTLTVDARNKLKKDDATAIYHDSLRSESFFVHLKHEMLLNPMKVFFSFSNFIDTVILSEANPIRLIIPNECNIVRFRQFDYGLCWLCSALNVLYLAQRKYEIGYKNAEFQPVWEKTQKTYHILDVAKYYFFKKKGVKIPNDQSEFKMVYNDGGYHYLMWEMLTGTKTIKHDMITTSNQFHESFQQIVEDPAFYQLCFFNFRVNRNSSYHVVGAVKMTDFTLIYDSQKITTLKLEDYLFTYNNEDFHKWDYQIHSIKTERRKQKIIPEKSNAAPSNVISRPKIDKNVMGVTKQTQPVTTILLQLLKCNLKSDVECTKD